MPSERVRHSALKIKEYFSLKATVFYPCFIEAKSSSRSQALKFYRFRLQSLENPVSEPDFIPQTFPETVGHRP